MSLDTPPQQGDRFSQAELQQLQLEQQKTLLSVVTQIRASLDLNTILQAAVAEVWHFFALDRVSVLQIPCLNPAKDWNAGQFVAEEVTGGLNSVLAVDPSVRSLSQFVWAQHHPEQIQRVQLQAIADINTANLSAADLQTLNHFQVKASLTAPLMQGDRLWEYCAYISASPPVSGKLAKLNPFNKLRLILRQQFIKQSYCCISAT